MFECFQFLLDFHLLSNCITWGHWFLVMHEFTLALVGSINTFTLHIFFLRRMLLVATPLNGWFLQLNKFWSKRITDAASTNITVCRMSSLLLTFSTFFDNNGGAGLTHKILSICNCVLLKDCWIWWLVLVAKDSVDDYPWESRLPSELPVSVSKTPKWILSLSLFV